MQLAGDTLRALDDAHARGRAGIRYRRGDVGLSEWSSAVAHAEGWFARVNRWGTIFGPGRIPNPARSGRKGRGVDAEVALDRDGNGRIVIKPTGELDLATMRPLAAAMRSCDDGAHVIVDLTKVTFLDSSVLSLLAETRRRCDVSVVGARGIVQRIFEVSGMDFMLTE